MNKGSARNSESMIFGYPLFQGRTSDDSYVLYLTAIKMARQKVQRRCSQSKSAQNQCFMGFAFSGLALSLVQPYPSPFRYIPFPYLFPSMDVGSRNRRSRQGPSAFGLFSKISLVDLVAMRGSAQICKEVRSRGVISSLG